MAGTPAQDMHSFSRKRGVLGGKLESALKGGDLNPQIYIKKIIKEMFVFNWIFFKLF